MVFGSNFTANTAANSCGGASGLPRPPLCSDRSSLGSKVRKSGTMSGTALQLLRGARCVRVIHDLTIAVRASCVVHACLVATFDLVGLIDEVVSDDMRSSSNCSICRPNAGMSTSPRSRDQYMDQ